jgi:hypothetical protein
MQALFISYMLYIFWVHKPEIFYLFDNDYLSKQLKQYFNHQL